MQVDVTPNPGAPPLVDGKVTLYMTPEMKKANAHMPYASHWSFGGKDYHHMMTWITSQDGGNGPGGSQLTYLLALMQTLAIVPPSVGGSAYLAYNIQNEGEETKSATDEQWGWSSNTVPGHSGPRFPGDGWESSWNCPYDFFVPRVGRWLLNHYGFSFTNYPYFQPPYSRFVPLVIRDWIIYGNDTARYTLYSDGETNVKLQLKGLVLPDVFPLTNLTYKLRIRKEGAGARGIVYTGEGTIPSLTPGSDRKFTITHPWNGKASVNINMQDAHVTRDEPVPGGRYQVEWTLLSCKEGLEAPLCLNSKGNWVIDKANPIKGGTVTVGTIALDEITVQPQSFIPENQACQFTTVLYALPKGSTFALPTPVHVWIDIDPVPTQPSASLGPPGQGSIARCELDLPVGTVLPYSLNYIWTGGKDRSIVIFIIAIGAGIWIQTAPSDRVPNGNYRFRITAKPKTPNPSKDYHNSVTKNVTVVSEIELKPIIISAETKDAYGLPCMDLSSPKPCEFSTSLCLASKSAGPLPAQDILMTVEVIGEFIKTLYSSDQKERYLSVRIETVASKTHRVTAEQKMPVEFKYIWRGGDSIRLATEEGSLPPDPSHVKFGKYYIKITATPTLAGTAQNVNAAFTTKHPTKKRHAVIVDSSRNNRVLVIVTPNDTIPLDARIGAFKNLVKKYKRWPKDETYGTVISLVYDKFTNGTELSEESRFNDRWGELYEEMGKKLDLFRKQGFKPVLDVLTGSPTPTPDSTWPNVKRIGACGTGWNYYPLNSDNCGPSCVYCAVTGLNIKETTVGLTYACPDNGGKDAYDMVYAAMGGTNDRSRETAKVGDVLILDGHNAMVTEVTVVGDPTIAGMDGGKDEMWHGVYEGRQQSGWERLNSYTLKSVWHLPPQGTSTPVKIYETYDDD